MQLLFADYESARQFETVLKNTTVAEELGSAAVIEKIESNGSIYTIFAQKCRVVVGVSCGTMPPGLIGPCPLVLDVGKAECTPN